jgi:hypothetical protein
MDFIGIIRSLEELLYEVMSWLIFYPRTLWKTLRDPGGVAAYSDAEQDQEPDERYTETLSPPLLLMITMVLTYVLSHWIGVDEPVATTEAGQSVTESPKNLLLLRALIFAIIPLVISVIGMRGGGIDIDRNTLRRPFYSQCFLVAPFALMLQSAFAVYLLPGYGSPAAIILGLAAFLWFVWAQTGWFAARLNVSCRVALVWGTASVLAAVIVGGVITIVIATSL